MSRIVCRIVRGPLRPAELLDRLPSSPDGALLLFCGVVRDHNEGRAVSALTYQAYDRMAEAELRRIAEEAAGRWQVGAISVEHRVGELAVGETSVAIGVAAPHREAAYQASRYLIEELKRRVPIWKRERYGEEEERWLGSPAAGEVGGA